MVISLMVVACTSKQAIYTVKGTISDSVTISENTVAIIQDVINGDADTVQVSGHTFEYIGVVDISTIKRVSLIDNGVPVKGISARFIPEQGEITIELGTKGSVEGSFMNNALRKLYRDEAAIQWTRESRRDALAERYQGEEFRDSIDALFADIDARINRIYNEVYFANLDNALGLAACEKLGSKCETVEAFDELISYGADFIKNYPPFAKIREHIAEVEKSSPGKMFLDFPGTTPDGKPCRLSDYVGKGRYVVIDFWGSWCHSCIAEMPNIKKLYDKYHKRGLDIVSIAIWDGDNSKTKKALKELDMPWIHIFTGEDPTAPELYSLEMMSTLILFAPDGTILKKSIRASKFEEILDSVI